MSQQPLAPAALQALVAAQRQRIHGSNPYAAAMARITAAQQSYVQQQTQQPPQSSLPQIGPPAPSRGEIPAVFNPLIVNAFRRYWIEGTYSDLALDSGTRTFFVHRTILALHSKYFRTLLDGPFKESGKKSIELVDDHPVVLKWFLYSLYNFGTPDAATAAMPERYMLSLMVSIYLMADKYGCEDLMKWIAQSFYTHWTKRRDTKEVLEALSVVFTASSHRLRQELFKGFDPIVRADLAGFFRHADRTKTLLSAPDWLMRQTAMLAYELHGGWN